MAEIPRLSKCQIFYTKQIFGKKSFTKESARFLALPNLWWSCNSEKIQQKFPDLKVIASGGVTVMDDLLRLKDMGVYGTILGKAFYEGNISLKDLEKYNSNAY